MTQEVFIPIHIYVVFWGGTTWSRTSSPLWMRLQELMMILFSFSTLTTSVMQLGEHEWLMYLSITQMGGGFIYM